MRARAWLDEVRKSAARIEDIVREIRALEQAHERVEAWVSSGSGGPRPRNATGDPTATQAQRRMAELEPLIAMRRRSLEEHQELVGSALAVLSLVADEVGRRDSLALELYYVDGADTWSEVAQEMHVSLRTAQRCRERAIDWLESHSPLRPWDGNNSST